MEAKRNDMRRQGEARGQDAARTSAATDARRQGDTSASKATDARRQDNASASEAIDMRQQGESRTSASEASGMCRQGGLRTSANAANDIAGIFSRHVKTVYRLCYSYLASPQDAEDATQAVFMKLIANPRSFDDADHEKAWLLVVAANYCKDVLKSAQRTRSAEMPPDVEDSRARTEPSDVLEAVLALPVQYKDCVYLHYYEGYKTDEIARMTDTPPSTIRNRLRDARALLKTALEGE